MIASSLVSVLILWSGDFKARLQFDGPLKTEIKGEFIDILDKNNKPFESEKSCDVYGRFDEVLIQEKNHLEKVIKANFKFLCTDPTQTKDSKDTTTSKSQVINIAPEYISLVNLKNHSNQVFISNKFKNNNFKIEDYSVQAVKKKK